MIEDLEAGFTGASIYASNTDNVDLAEVANDDESITAETNFINDTVIDIKEEQNNESYKEKMNINIENINTIEKRHKVYTK